MVVFWVFLESVLKCLHSVFQHMLLAALRVTSHAAMIRWEE